MTDKISKLHRSWLMSRIKCKHTKPEILARSLLHRLGYRFTINGPKNKTLPGKPDIVLPRYRAVVFVHGCFWHRHADCKHATTPRSNTAYWLPKLQRNAERDLANETQLEKLGWHVIVLWECQLKNLDTTAAQIINRLPRQTALRYPETIDDAALVAETKTLYKA